MQYKSIDNITLNNLANSLNMKVLVSTGFTNLFAWNNPKWTETPEKQLIQQSVSQ